LKVAASNNRASQSSNRRYNFQGRGLRMTTTALLAHSDMRKSMAPAIAQVRFLQVRSFAGQRSSSLLLRQARFFVSVRRVPLRAAAGGGEGQDAGRSWPVERAAGRIRGCRLVLRNVTPSGESRRSTVYRDMPGIAVRAAEGYHWEFWGSILTDDVPGNAGYRSEGYHWYRSEGYHLKLSQRGVSLEIWEVYQLAVKIPGCAG
jgi:hypothetical protein